MNDMSTQAAEGEDGGVTGSMDDWFDDRKAAQVAAFFCQKAGDTIDVLKLVKLIYLADRKSMQRSAYPITNDRFVSMQHGPVNSLTLNCIDGSRQSDAWRDLIAARADHKVRLARKLTDEDFDDLSDFEIEVLKDVWDEFGHMRKFEIRDWTHDHLPEWTDPDGSSKPLPHTRVLRRLGINDSDGKLFAEAIDAERRVAASFKKLRA